MRARLMAAGVPAALATLAAGYGTAAAPAAHHTTASAPAPADTVAPGPVDTTDAGPGAGTFPNDLTCSTVVDDTGWKNGPLDAQRTIAYLTSMLLAEASPTSRGGRPARMTRRSSMTPRTFC